MLEPPSRSIEVTTVPGGPSTVSTFSVSPDDRRIAVVVEDFSSPSSISIRLYVEDLIGGGHHADIYTASVPKGKVATTIFPAGWHSGRLILGVWRACSFERVFNPTAWHVVDALTATRFVSIGDSSCVASSWPSPAGVACYVLAASRTDIYDWRGAVTASFPTSSGATELSPSGASLFAGLGGPNPSTTVVKADGSGSVTVPGQIGCEWIDDSHVLAYDAVITYPSGAVVTLSDGECAGRFPGGL